MTGTGPNRGVDVSLWSKLIQRMGANDGLWAGYIASQQAGRGVGIATGA